jgi:RNA polymerase sigma factor (sigma-70 family)
MSLVLLRSQTDERLVALAGEGHERAFEAIVKRYRRPLYAACRRMVPDARAEDVLQQSLVSAWTALRRGDEVRDLRAWLFRIVRNAAVSELRRSGHAPPQLLDTLIAAPSPQEEAERRAVVHETLATIARLPERQRATLLRSAVCCSEPAPLRASRLDRGRAVASALVPLSWLRSGGGEPRVAELVAAAAYATDGSWRTGKLTERAT